MSDFRRRLGFTLVELLVVAALFLLFFSMVATGIRPNAVSQVRQLSQDLSSAILAAQTRALTSEAGAGLMIVSSTTVLTAQSPPYIVGTVSGLTATSTSLAGTFTPTNADAADLTTAYVVKLVGGSGNAVTPWLSFTPPGTAVFNASLNQTMNNTLLPTGVSRFMAARLPVLGAQALTVPKFAAIDLRYSGVGMVTADPFGTLSTSGTVSLLFDRNGCLDTLTRTSGSPATISAPAPLYLLVASAADIAANTSLTSLTSRWIAIAPDTGRVTVATNVSVAFSGAPTDAVINNARFNARQAITQGAR
jgi:prepilin-type N-terminal cleavage/methylation domain-containing protein